MEAALAALLAAPDDAAPDAPTLPRAAVSRLLAAFDEERHTIRAFASTATGTSQAPPGAIPASFVLVEPLTRREEEVLRLLATGTSNAAIADALSISPFTVKRHVGSLLGKLGATSRTGAAARARDAGLL